MRVWLILLVFPLSLAAQDITLDSVTHQGLNILTLNKPGKGNYSLLDPETGNTYPLQWLNEQTALAILPGPLKTGLKVKQTATPKVSVTLTRNKNGILASAGKKKIFYYQSSTAMPPPDSPAYYQRSGFIHPLYSPAGKVLTDDFPVTHAHQHAIFHAWANTRFRGTHVDFWNQFKKEGTVQHKSVLSSVEGPVFSELVTSQEYISVEHGVVLSDKWTIRIYASSRHYMIDLYLDQENITNDTLFLDKYIYGGMAFRGAAQWDPQNKNHFQNRWNVLTNEGLRDSAANHTSANWVTVSGQIDGVHAAVTVFGHPENFRSPQKVRVHPTMPYWVFSPVVDAPFSIPPGGKYSARYRYLVSDESPDQEELTRVYEQWIRL